MIPTTSPTNAVQPPRRPRFRPEVTPACRHCGELGPCGYSLHVGGLCVRLVADHPGQAELVAGVKMRPVELMVNGVRRWVWTRSDVSAMDVDDMVVLFESFEPPPPPRRVVNGGAGKRPEPVALFSADPSSPPPPTPRQPSPRLTIPVPTMATTAALFVATTTAPAIGPTW